MRRLQATAMRLAIAGLAAFSLGIALVVASLAHASGTPAFADSSAYELFCPGTPVGNIVLNGVVTTGTISPASPAAGQQFSLTNYQSTVALPSSIVSAAAALGNWAIIGTAVTKVDATGATPAAISGGDITINAPIPSPVPSNGLTLRLPSTPVTVGPFTASGGDITLTVDPAISLSLMVSGSSLDLTCTPYPNNAAPRASSQVRAAGAKASPVIATSARDGNGRDEYHRVGKHDDTTTTPSANVHGALRAVLPGHPGRKRGAQRRRDLGHAVACRRRPRASPSASRATRRW